MRKSSDRKAKGERRKANGSFKIVSCLLPFALCLLLFAAEGFAQPPSPYAVERLSGQKAPDFTLKDINGNTVSLSSFKGKVVLLNFWATWCPPCRAEIPSMNKLNQLLKNKGLVILAVSTDRAIVDVKDFLKNNPVNFAVVVDYNLSVSRSLYKVFMVPTTFLIDKRGIVVEKYFGEQDWTEPEMIKEIEALL
ncbi:MAG: TlpA disulfide reductase family protein [Nitrospiraceae bacterium]|nr:TlpA family protein disulfide reductase [Nitrospirota bacterium]MDA8337814.1 TlpA disulfide reductase family protein [Nitrospiraceae bacterium]